MNDGDGQLAHPIHQVHCNIHSVAMWAPFEWIKWSRGICRTESIEVIPASSVHETCVNATNSMQLYISHEIKLDVQLTNVINHTVVVTKLHPSEYGTIINKVEQAIQRYVAYAELDE